MRAFREGSTPQAVREPRQRARDEHLAIDPGIARRIMGPRRFLSRYWPLVDPTDAYGQFCDRGRNYMPAIFVTPEQKAKLKQWITEGAGYQPHWAFLPPVRPLLPLVDNNPWPRNQIDHFILHELEAHQLAPSPDADRTTLLRRVTYDLTGDGRTHPAAP